MLQLEIVADAHFLGFAVLFQETVVVTSAPADAVATGVEDHARHEDKVYRSLISIGLRFRHMEFALTQTLLAQIRTDLHIMAVGNGKQQGLGIAVFGKEGTQVNLVVDGIVEQYGSGVLESAHVLYLREDGGRVGCGGSGGIDTAALFDQGTESLLPVALFIPRHQGFKVGNLRSK